MNQPVKPREFFGLSNPMRSSSATGNAFPFWENEKSAIQEKEWGWRGDLIHVIEKSFADQLQAELKAKDELLRECEEALSFYMYQPECDCIFNCSCGYDEKHKIHRQALQKLREGNK